MREKEIEQRLTKEIKRIGGICPKFVSPGFAGMPDRIVLMPEGMVCFAELKAPGEVMRPLQMKRKKQLEALGFRVYCIDSMDSIREAIDEIQRT